MYRGAAGSPQLAHREGVRVSIVTSSKWSPGIPNGRRSCVLGFKVNKLGPCQNAQCGAGVTLHGAVRGAGTPILLRAHARFTGPRRSPAWQPGGSGTGWGCSASAPRPRPPPPSLPAPEAVCSAAGARERAAGAQGRLRAARRSEPGSARLRGAASPWGTPSITTQSIPPSLSPPCPSPPRPSPTCPSPPGPLKGHIKARLRFWGWELPAQHRPP